jgi:hypothetical protein
MSCAGRAGSIRLDPSKRNHVPLSVSSTIRVDELIKLLPGRVALLRDQLNDGIDLSERFTATVRYDAPAHKASYAAAQRHVGDWGGQPTSRALVGS